ncbi:MAG: sensor domain-containing diguanylate cyclase [Candidatus Marinimicrobia bacterium]|nr:sensor domain-containing diguanylate cyclase [Candidatus Neomarinimicrobiota bacterium]
MGTNEEDQFMDSIEIILDMIVASNPKLNVVVYFQNNLEGSLFLRGFRGEENLFNQELPLDNPIVEKVINDKKIMLVTPDKDEDAIRSFFSDFTSLPASTSLFVSPINYDDLNIGVLITQVDQYRDFDEKDEKTIDLATQVIGGEFIHFREISDLRSDNLFYAQLHAFQNGLDISHPKEELLTSILRFCERNFVFDKLTISMVTERKDEAVIKAVIGFTMDFGEGDTFQLKGTIHGTVIRDGVPIKYDNMTMDSTIKSRFNSRDIEEFRFLSFLGVPIRNKHGTIGCLALESFGSKKYTDSDYRVLGVIADQFGTLLDWWQDYGAVRKSARYDGLTKLLNRRSFLERFEDEISRAGRYQDNLVLMILDLDKFKRINDTYGHLYGDFVLAETASRLKNSVRNIDIVARYGGEEFAIILINATKKGTITTAKRTVESIANSKFEKDDIAVNMAISAGIAEYPSDGSTVHQLIAIADEAMYDVKRKGGNDVGIPSRTNA